MLGADTMTRTSQLRLAAAAAALLLGVATISGQGNPTTGGPVDPLLLEDLALSYRILTDRGVVDGLGHVSIRHPANPQRYLISQNRATGVVTPADIMEMDLDSRPVNPNLRSYNEVAIHAEIYKIRPDVNAVVHHHAPGTVSWGMGKIPMQPMNQSSRWMLDGVPFVDYRNFSQIPGDRGWEETNLVHTPARGEMVARALGFSGALLLVNHGAVVVGGSIYEAVGRSIYMEINTAVQTAAILRGGGVTYYDAAGELRATGSRSDFARQWELWKHESCPKAGFCKPEFGDRMAVAGRGGREGRGGRGGDAPAGGRGGRGGRAAPQPD